MRKRIIQLGVVCCVSLTILLPLTINAQETISIQTEIRKLWKQQMTRQLYDFDIHMQIIEKLQATSEISEPTESLSNPEESYDMSETVTVEANATPLASPLTHEIYTQTILKSINKERMDQNLGPVCISDELMEVAHWKASDMAKNKSMNHYSITLETNAAGLLNHFDVQYAAMNENIAFSSGYNDLEIEANLAMELWMKSPGHKVNILDPYVTLIGIGYADGYGVTIMILPR